MFVGPPWAALRISPVAVSECPVREATTLIVVVPPIPLFPRGQGGDRLPSQPPRADVLPSRCGSRPGGAASSLLTEEPRRDRPSPTRTVARPPCPGAAHPRGRAHHLRSGPGPHRSGGFSRSAVRGALPLDGHGTERQR